MIPFKDITHKTQEAIIEEAENKLFLQTDAPVRHSGTGLPMVIWVSTKVDIHGCRIKVQKIHGDKINDNDLVHITVEDVPKVIGVNSFSNKDIRLIKKFVLLNKQALLDYWNHEIDVSELLDLFRANIEALTSK